MSGGGTCPHKDHRPFWVVGQRQYNMSAFNGYHRTPSDYSLVWCTVEGCRSAWRTKAAYVDALPNACSQCEAAAQTSCRVCHRGLCSPCSTNHHHEGYGVPATDTR